MANITVDRRRRLGCVGLGALMLSLAAGARAEDPLVSAADPPASDASETYALHGQATFVAQFHPAFNSPYVGPNSLTPNANGRETWDLTLFDGYRPWKGAEIWINPEIDQGFGLSGTLGLAAFPSGEAYKVGAERPYVKLPRLFLRQTIELGGETQRVEAAANQLAGRQTANRLVFTVGRFSVPDVFDANDYAHDTKHDFLNWAIIDTGTFDYAADAWGYTMGGAAEWYQGPWTLRGAIMDLSAAPNSTALDNHFGQFQLIGEGERRWTLGGEAGAAKITGFWSRGRMGKYDAATDLAEETGRTPAVALVRQYRSRGGFGLDAQQQLSGDLGVFLRAGVANGDIEPYEFADIDRTVALGLSLKGKSWKRPDDFVGLAGVEDGITAEHQAYLAAGGLGILIGDGRLPHPGDERGVETFYDMALGRYLRAAIDWQIFQNPAYNRDRGPVSIFGARLHAQF